MQTTRITADISFTSRLHASKKIRTKCSLQRGTDRIKPIHPLTSNRPGCFLSQIHGGTMKTHLTYPNTATLKASLIALSLLLATPILLMADPPAKPAAAPELRLPRIFGDNMVLQRDAQVQVWGWAHPDAEITVKIAGQECRTKANGRGKWSLKLDAVKAGGPHEMVVSAGNESVTFKNVLIGEVWVCSGQSNMQFTLGSAANSKEAIADAQYPQIRHITVSTVNSRIPLDDLVLSAPWTVCDPKTAGSFTAVGYFFGRELHKNLQVPVGLIHSSWGGTMIEPWTPPAGFASVSNFEAVAKDVVKTEVQCRKDVAAMLDRIDAWSLATRKAIAEGEPLPLAPNTSSLYQGGGASGIYNAMISPLLPFTIRGAIWYQGESNLGNGLLYRKRMEALIAGWRKVWGLGDFPFYFVQIAPYKYNAAQPQQLPLLWQAQTASLEIPNTGMAVITDVGEANDIHPKKKQEVGTRLALWALAKTYAKDNVVYSGPLYKSMAIEDGKIRISFNHVGGGLVARDGKPLDWFEIAGDDKKFSQARAEVDGETVVVSSEQVAKPVAVRFGWNNIAMPNLTNKEGLPASPFKTDDW
ncbi:MAG: 9-O-acetylesterase [Verrucomicrobia bacterium]|nr:9-O-acetylesterase [Verrucomicrobiota bacterium]